MQIPIAYVHRLIRLMLVPLLARIFPPIYSCPSISSLSPRVSSESAERYIFSIMKSCFVESVEFRRNLTFEKKKKKNKKFCPPSSITNFYPRIRATKPQRSYRLALLRNAATALTRNKLLFSSLLRIQHGERGR